jgi:hypothetical protein
MGAMRRYRAAGDTEVGKAASFARYWGTCDPRGESYIPDSPAAPRSRGRNVRFP